MLFRSWRTQTNEACGPTNESAPCELYVHTELLQQREQGIRRSDPRKEQLPVLSFLATQPSSLRLNILVNEQDYKNPPTWLAHLLKHERFRSRLQITNFDFNIEDLPQKEMLVRAYRDVKTLANKSDLRRYAVLYVNGGLWFDTDTIFINDVRPLMGVDFVYVAGSRYNGAVMGASSQNSDFIRAAIEHEIGRAHV